MNNNQKANQIAIKQYRKELSAMIGDIKEIDKWILTTSVNRGLADVKKNTPVGKYTTDVNFTTTDGQEVSFTTGTAKVGGFMRKSWHSPRLRKTAGGIEKELSNSSDYSSYVNYGHRIVNKKGETVGFVKGQFMLEKATKKVKKAMEQQFKQEIERVKREHDK